MTANGSGNLRRSICVARWHRLLVSREGFCAHTADNQEGNSPAEDARNMAATRGDYILGPTSGGGDQRLCCRYSSPQAKGDFELGMNYALNRTASSCPSDNIQDARCAYQLACRAVTHHSRVAQRSDPMNKSSNKCHEIFVLIQHGWSMLVAAG